MQQPIINDEQTRHRRNSWPALLCVGGKTSTCERLGKFGVDTLFASDATQGFRIAGKASPSVIVTDYSMPNGDAHYLLHRLRSSPGTENIPVFVLTGKALNDPTALMLKRSVSGHPGAAQIFRKSFDTDELFGALQKFCGFVRVPSTPGAPARSVDDGRRAPC